MCLGNARARCVKRFLFVQKLDFGCWIDHGVFGMKLACWVTKCSVIAPGCYCRVCAKSEARPFVESLGEEEEEGEEEEGEEEAAAGGHGWFIWSLAR